MASVTFTPATGGDGSTVTDDSNATTGLGNGGHRTRFIPALTQVVNTAQHAVDMAADAADQVVLATAQAVAAAASAASAASSASTNGTSTTSLAIGTGSKVFTTQSGKNWVGGMNLIAAETANPSANSMFGVVTAYSGTSLTINVSQTAGSGTIAAWTISLSGPVLTTMPINEVKGADVASASTVNLDSVSGNLVHITGTTPITAFTLSAGRERTLVFDGIVSITHNATTLIIPGGEDITTNAGYIITVRGDTGGVRIVDMVDSSGPAGQGASTGTSSVTLTSVSPALQVINPTSFGTTVTMPDATTCAKGAVLHKVRNTGDFPIVLRNSAATLLGFVMPGVTVTIGLSDTSTAAGVWDCAGAEKVGVVAGLDTLATSVESSAIKVVELDSDRTLLILQGTANIYGVVYNNSTNTWGTPTLIRTASGSFQTNALLIATDKVLLNSATAGSTSMETVVLTFSGTTITVGTAVATTLASTLSVTSGFVAIGSSYVIGYYRTGAIVVLRAITVSGTTPTIGAELTTVSGTSIAPNMLFSVSATVGLVFTVTSTTDIWATTFTVSGSTCTLGTELNYTGLTTVGSIFVAPINSRWMLMYNDGSAAKANLISISGSTPTAPAATTFLTSVATLTAGTYTYTVVGSKIVAAWCDNSTVKVNLLTDNAGAIVAGTEIAYTGAGSSRSLASLPAYNSLVRVIVVQGSAGQVLSFSYSTSSAVLSYVTTGNFGFTANTLKGERGLGVVLSADNSSAYSTGVNIIRQKFAGVQFTNYLDYGQARANGTNNGCWVGNINPIKSLAVRKIEAAA